jgi:hypothetical protein
MASGPGTALTTRLVKPVISADMKEAKRNVLRIYKQFQRELPKHWWDYGKPFELLSRKMRKF